MCCSMKKTVIYVRRSLNEIKQKTSIPYQISACKEYAERQGWIVHEIFNEGEKSARSSELEERKELWRLMKEIKTGFIERIIVFKRDRISRRVDQYMEFVELLRTHNVSMYFAGDNEPQMFDGIIGDFVELLFGAISEHEGNNITQRLIQSRIAKVRGGEWGGGRPPKFYHIEEFEKDGKQERRLMLSEENKEQIKKVYEFVRDGDFKTVREANTALKKRYATHFKDVNLLVFIPNEIHKGLVTATYEGKVVRSAVVNTRLKAVDEKLWEEANEKLRRMEDTFVEKEAVLIKPKLEGIVLCQHCKKPLGVKRSYYICLNHGTMKINVEHLDVEIMKLVQSRISSHVTKNKQEIKEFFIQQLIAPLELESKKSEMNLQIAQVKLQRMTSKYLETPIQSKKEDMKQLLKPYVEDFRKCFRTLKSTKMKLEENRERLKLLLNQTLPVPIIQSLSNYKQKELLAFFINRIEVNTNYLVTIKYRNDMKN